MAQGISTAQGKSHSLSLYAHVALVCFATLLFRGVIDFLYVEYVTRFFSAEFPLIEGGLLRMVESYIIMLLLIIFITRSLRRQWRPSGIVPLIYFIVVMVPLYSLYGLADAPASLVYAATGSIIVLVAVTELLPRLRVPKPGPGFVHLWIILLFAMSVYVYGWLIFTGGLQRLNFNLLTVYDVRAEYVETRGPLMGYLIPWQGYVINILAFLYALRQRSYWLLAIVVLSQVLLFGMTGHKSFILAPLFSVGVYHIWRKRSAILLILIGSILIAAISYAYFLAFSDEFPPSLFVRRLFFVPALLHVLYYDFFSQPDHPFYMLSDSFLRYLVPNPYEMPTVHVIALNYFGREFSPNVGYLGDAYGNFGVLGMFLFSVVLGLVLRIADSLATRLSPHFVAAAFSMPVMALTQSALFTTLLTHGLLLATLSLWILSRVEIPSLKRDKHGTCRL